MASKNNLELDKSQKAAILMLCLDQSTTKQIFGQMTDEEVKRIGTALLNIKKVPGEVIEGVVTEFASELNLDIEPQAPQIGFEDLKFDGKNVATKLISHSLDEARSQNIISKLGSNIPATAEDLDGFGQIIDQYQAKDLFSLVKNEVPHIIAIFALHVDRTKAKELIDLFEEELQIQIVNHMSRIEIIPKHVIDKLQAIVAADLESKAEGTETQIIEDEDEDIEMEGMDQTLKMLKSLDPEKSEKIIEGILELDEELGTAIKKRMFVIEDLLRSDDAGIRELLKGVTNDDLKVALKETDEIVQDKFFNNMSSRAALILREDMEVMPSPKVDQMEKAQEIIIKLAKDLIKQEKLTLAAIDGE